MINFLNLEYFLVAAEELNFTRAAKKLFISQQSLSNHISNLEKNLTWCCLTGPPPSP